MSGPTLASRLERKILLVSSDAALAAELGKALPQRWSMTRTDDPATLGDFSEVLIYRFMLLDLEDPVIDAPEIIDAVRRQLMLNIAILCLGGSAGQRDAARLARADRFFERDAAVAVMQQFCGQYDW